MSVPQYNSRFQGVRIFLHGRSKLYPHISGLLPPYLQHPYLKIPLNMSALDPRLPGMSLPVAKCFLEHAMNA